MKGRVIYSELSKQGFDGGIFFDETSQYYLSDFYTTDGCVIVCADETALITDSRYIEAAELKKQGNELTDDVNVYLFTSLYDFIENYIKEHKIKSLAFDSTRTTVSQLERLRSRFPSTEFKAVDDICGKARRVKTASEVAKIKAAQEITDATFGHMLGFIRKGLTETECAAEMEYFMRKNGAMGLAFDTIAVSGKKSSMPHGVPGNEILTENSFFTMDFGAKYEGYCSDMTRTVVLGKADDEMKRVYETVLEAQLLGIKAAKAGVCCSEVDGVSRSHIEKRGYGGMFGHGLGHSLGLEIHESPRFSPKCFDEAQIGNIITVEPGIYVPGKYGVRIEDMVLITENGCENLTKSPKQLIEL